MTTLSKYIWVIDTLKRAGHRGLSLKELNEKWTANTDLSCGEPIPRQTFDRWKGQIVTLLGINIECHIRGGYRYYIHNPQALERGELSHWLLDTYSTLNTLSANTALKDRIMVESVPSSHRFLTEIINAMRENRVLLVTHRGFTSDRGKTIHASPYCVRMFRRRWYMLAHVAEKDEMRLYALDRMQDVEATGERFAMPADFDAREYFATYFGVVMHSEVNVERVVIRADDRHANYLRTLPLHPSQREIGSGEGYADFELMLRPTYDLVMELLRVGAMVEVLEPQSLRSAMRGWIRDMYELYEDD